MGLDYFVVEAFNVDNLATQVDTWMSRGFICQGGVCYVPTSGAKFLQAMRLKREGEV